MFGCLLDEVECSGRISMAWEPELEQHEQTASEQAKNRFKCQSVTTQTPHTSTDALVEANRFML